MNHSLHTQELTDFIYSLNNKSMTDLMGSVRATYRAMCANRTPDHEFLERQQRLQSEAYTLITDSVSIAVHRNTPVPYFIADDFCSYLQSLDRGILLVRLQKAMPATSWAKLFIEHWTGVETADYILSDLKQAIAQVGLTSLREHMTEDDKDKYESLPDVLTVYRGCANGGDGLSWTLDKNTAQLFVHRKEGAYDGFMKMRLMVSTSDSGLREDIYNATPKPVGLYTGTVKKEDCLVFFHRNEQEVFSNCVQVHTVCGEL